MSSSVRQNNLFLAENWEAVYRSFKDIDFRAYDFETIRNALIDYVRTYYPENFNDYIESSEFIAVVELLAWLGSTLAFRVDLNSRENFLDTAERRESIVRLARMLNYQPRRNQAASGLVKLTAVETNEPVLDSQGRDLARSTIFWNDPNNPDSFEQFIAILNGAFAGTNPFGRPLKSGVIGAVPTDLYRFESTEDSDIAYSISVRLRSQTIPVNIVNVDFEDNEFFFERHPDTDNPFHLIYRNDGEGLGSRNTGFFLFMKQGSLQSEDFSFDAPISNRTADVDVQNINETDVYLQEIDDEGTVLNKWTRTPALAGNNIIYNDVPAEKRNIFSVIPRQNDEITLRFGDGNFGNVPTGLFRLWFRTSINQNLIIRPENIQNSEIRIPYRGKDGQRYTLRMVFSLVDSINNATTTETNEEIKQRAPQVYYTQNRMVTGEDYNVFPLTRGSEIVKIKAVNRTHSGHSRFIDINDPTGSFQNTSVSGEDGALWADNQPSLLTVSTEISDEEIVKAQLEEFLGNQFLQNFFYSEFHDSYLAQSGNQNHFNLLLGAGTDNLRWITEPSRARGATGVLSTAPRASTALSNYIDTNSGGATPAVRLIKEGCKIKFVEPSQVQDDFPTKFQWVTVRSVKTETDGGQDYSLLELSEIVQDDWIAVQTLPSFRRFFNEVETLLLSSPSSGLGLKTAFGIGYDITADDYNGRWFIIEDSQGSEDYVYSSAIGGGLPDSWLIYAEYNTTDETWSFTSRGRRYVFESADQARFFFDENFRLVDVQKGRALRDTIELLTINTKNQPQSPLDSTSLPRPALMNIQSLLMYEDGYRDPRKVIVKPTDEDRDGVPDDPRILEEIINNFDSPPQNVYFRRFTDFDGYEYFQLWKHRGITVNSIIAGQTIRQITTNVWIVDGVAGGLPRSLEATNADLITLGSAVSVSDLLSEINVGMNQIKGTQFENTVIEKNNELFVLVYDTVGNTVTAEPTSDYALAVGRSFTLNDVLVTQNPLYFRWKHFAPRQNRIDPSISNIIDMYIVTNSYFRDVIRWKSSNSRVDLFPESPTSESLRVQFGELNQFKVLSDQIVFKPAQFKLLFGVGAEPELSAKFNVVKLPTTTLTDNEVKSRVIDAIDEYFDILNWDFGERFYYTELSAYIHQKLSNIISTVVIVPQNADSAFGNLFQIKSEPNELFLSTATVADVEIVRNLTETNLRIRR